MDRNYFTLPCFSSSSSFPPSPPRLCTRSESHCSPPAVIEVAFPFIGHAGNGREEKKKKIKATCSRSPQRFIFKLPPLLKRKKMCCRLTTHHQTIVKKRRGGGNNAAIVFSFGTVPFL